MSQRDEKLALYREFVIKHNLTLDDALLAKVTVGLGPSIYNKDSESIACSDQSELDTVRKNFLIKKLGLTLEEAELNAAIKEICETIGSSVRTKYRAVFYTLLTQKFNKQEIYG